MPVPRIPHIQMLLSMPATRLPGWGRVIDPFQYIATIVQDNGPATRPAWWNLGPPDSMEYKVRRLKKLTTKAASANTKSAQNTRIAKIVCRRLLIMKWVSTIGGTAASCAIVREVWQMYAPCIMKSNILRNGVLAFSLCMGQLSLNFTSKPVV